MKIICINGPNLNMLGERDKGHYGKLSLQKIEKILQKEFPLIAFTFFQSNVEGEIILLGNELNLKPQEKRDSKFLLILPKTAITKMNTPIIISVYSNNKLLKDVSTSFLGPAAEKGKS